jgi:hypothetical protein
MQTVDFGSMISLIDSGERVKIEYCTYDETRKTGGKLRTIEGRVTKKKAEQAPAEILRETTSAKSKRNHYFNFTRIFIVMMGEKETSVLKPVHLPLVLKINDKRVML